MIRIEESKLRQIIRTEYMKMMIEALSPKLPPPGKHKMQKKDKKDKEEKNVDKSS